MPWTRASKGGTVDVASPLPRSLGLVRTALMELTAEMRACLDEAVPCWVATADVEMIVAPSPWLFPDEPESTVRQRVLDRYGVRDC